ncbi:YqcI/YcgG family protein, partial [Neisseria meningitidis]
LLEYTRFCKEIIAKDRLYFPLILIFNFQLDTLEASQNKAWEILKQIFQFNQDNFNDEDVLNPNQAGWKFRFNGVNLFFNINHPQHILHKSRNVNSYLTMVVNPSENFLIVAPVVNGERKISNLIRDRVKQYNNGIIADTLSINDDTKPDWKQYQHEEGNVKLPLICPFSNMEKSKC